MNELTIKKTNDLVNNYYKWLRNNTFTRQDNMTDWVIIETPFMDLFNDFIQIFLDMLKDDYANERTKMVFIEISFFDNRINGNKVV